jgi:mxaJ protein
VWWSHQRGLVRRVLNTERCDVLIGIPKGYDLVGWTKPYYRTGYVIAYRKEQLGELRSLDDPRLKTLRVGVQVNTPPHVALGRRGIVGGNVVGYQLMYDSNAHPEEYPGRVVEDLLAGRLDVALVWGPIAGYFQQKKGAASLAMVPIEEAQAENTPFAFDISMGVRKSDKELKARLEQAIERRQEEIKAILQSFGVPLMPVAAPPAPAGTTPAGTTPSPGAPAPGGATSNPTPAPGGAAKAPDGRDGQRKGGS